MKGLQKMLVLNKTNTTMIPFAHGLISIASIAALFNSGISFRNDKPIEFFVEKVSNQCGYSIPKTIMINEPNGYGRFLHAIEEQHTNELFAAYELVHINLECQVELASYLITLKRSKITGSEIEDYLMKGNIFIA